MHESLVDILKPGMFEVHITAPLMESGKLLNLAGEFEGIGLKDNHYFLRVFNVPINSNYPQPSNTPITGHDIENPGLMYLKFSMRFLGFCGKAVVKIKQNI